MLSRITEAKYNDVSDQPKDQRQAIVTRAIAAVNRIAGPSSPYVAEIRRLQSEYPHLHEHTTSVMGVLRALRADLAEGYLQTLEELVHANVFGDFMAMAAHLQSSGYKDAAAVVAGATLESHLRSLCIKNGVDPTISGRPKRLDRMNADLRSADVYSKLDQKSVTAWADLRNKAAHGDYEGYEETQVEHMLAGITDFIRRHPA